MFKPFPRQGITYGFIVINFMTPFPAWLNSQLSASASWAASARFPLPAPFFGLALLLGFGSASRSTLSTGPSLVKDCFRVSK